ncbi:hypothetical protein [Deinococcus rubellus]|uniref:hypothetical protein n=1 Tax=Deinococcus rubellus TaxID=1889240 RepID=UPI0031EBD6B4
MTPGKSRSEVVSRLIQAHAARPAAVKFADVPLFAAPTATSPAPGSNPTPSRTGARELRAGWRVARVSSHTQIIHELSQGAVLAFTGGAWVLTQQNGARRIIGPSAVRDMLKLGILEDAD